MNKDWKGFKPCLFPNDEVDTSTLNYSKYYASEKKDGVRILLTREGVFGRSLKPIRNINIQNELHHICSHLGKDQILEAELWDPNLPCHIISGIVNSKDKKVPYDLEPYAFDLMSTNKQEEIFDDRYKNLRALEKELDSKDLHINVIHQTPIASEKHLLKIYNDYVTQGGEGLILRHGSFGYKYGRITMKSGAGYKLKPSKEVDGVILEIHERMLNTNKSEKNELGRSFKKNNKLNKQPTGIAATITIKLEDGVVCKATLKGSEDERREIWDNKEYYISRVAVIKAMAHGEKDSLRHPRVLRIK